MESGSEKLILYKLKQFLETLKTSNWDLPPSEKTIDNIFKCALELEEVFNQEEKSTLNELLKKNYPTLNFNKPFDFLIESIIKSQTDEHLTLYALKKYTTLYSENDLIELLQKLLSEAELRQQIFNIFEENPDVYLDLYRLNNFLCDIMNSSDIKSKVKNSLKSETLLFLNSVKHAEFLTAQTLIDEMISCLECQKDLKLWFLLMKEENIQAVLDLCTDYNNFLHAVLKFFDKYAEEMESKCDEQLNVQYSHVRLDFEDFVKIFQLFLNNEKFNKKISEFLGSKDLTNENFLFWVDVKSCL